MELNLTFPQGRVTCKHHLRSASGSNGLEAKEVSPLLGSGPILIARGALIDCLPSIPHRCNTIILHLIRSINEFQTAVCLGALFLPDAVGLAASGPARRSHLRRHLDSPL